MADENRVFISYATDTKPLAQKLVRGLEREGIPTWTDFKALKPGQRLADEVEYALDKANWYLILVSPQSHATPGEEAEWRAVLAKAWSNSDKKLVPVLAGGSDPPPFLRQWVSLRIDPKAEPRNWTSQVLQVLRSAGEPLEFGLANRNRQEREKRLGEMARAVEASRNPELGTPDPQP